MNPDDRALALDLLLARERSLIETLSSLSAGQWNFRLAEGAWTPAECVEHIVLVEASIVRQLETPAGGPPADAAAKALTEGKDTLVLRAVPDRRRRALAPGTFRPRGAWTPENAIGRFGQTRGRTVAFTRSTTANLRDVVWPHPFFKELDGVQWLLFAVVHGERHRLQIEETLNG